MKKLICVLLILSVLLSLCACGGDVYGVEIVDWEPSVLYTDREVRSAMRAVMRYFGRGFNGCKLTQLAYPGDSAADEFEQWAEQYGADEAIVIYSSFDVDASGGNGSLEPNSTYRNWKWVLVRNHGGVWQHKTHGYG